MIILLNCIINIIKILLRRKRIIIQLNVNKNNYYQYFDEEFPWKHNK